MNVPCYSYVTGDELPLLQFVTLRDWRTIEKRVFTSVEEVEILSEVDPKHKALIDSKTMKVRVNY